MNRVTRPKGRWSAYWERLRASFWFVPASMVTGALVLAFATLWLDHRLIEGGKEGTVPFLLFGGGQDGAREVLAVVAGSMLTVTSLTFSITIVALQLASSQFGPRVLHNYLRDRGNQFVLGTFVATFTFALVVLRSVRGDDFGGFTPHLSVTITLVLAIVSLFVLVYFVNHVAQSIRVEYVAAGIGREFRRKIESVFPEELGEGPPEESHSLRAEREVEEVVRTNGSPVLAKRTGYVQAVDEGTLMRASRDGDRIVRLEVRPGMFVSRHTVVARVWPPEPGGTSDAGNEVRDAFVFGMQRTLVQDVGFAAYQLAEVAIRSLSPSLNDPHTAMLCIEYLGAGFEELLGRRIPSPYRYEGSRLRVIAHGPDFVQILEESISPVARYARDAPDVLVRIATTLERIAPRVRRREDWVALVRQLEQIAAMIVGNEQLRPADREMAEEALERVRESLRRHAPVAAPAATEPVPSGPPT